jgi:hypothetical protein
MADMAVRFRSGPVARSDNYPRSLGCSPLTNKRLLSDELSRNDSVRRPNPLAPQGTFEDPSSPLSGRRSEAPSQWPELALFDRPRSAVGASGYRVTSHRAWRGAGTDES